jgi:hypothetical protein
MLDVDRFWRDGFLVIPRVFDPAQVQRWRERALQRQNKASDLLTDEVLREVVLSETLLGFADEILGDQPIYFGDSTAMIGPSGWGFHKDNSDRLDAKAPDWKVDRYPIIRFGVYTQPHGKEPGSIEFRRGSHMHPDYTTGERFAAPCEPGDVIVWNSRTTHSANSRIVRGLGIRMMPDPYAIPFRAITRFKAEWLFQPLKQERVALFVSYGRDDPLLDRHIEYLRHRAYPWDAWKVSNWSQQTRELAQARGLGLIDVTAFEYQGWPLAKDYAPIPYA